MEQGHRTGSRDTRHARETSAAASPTVPGTQCATAVCHTLALRRCPVSTRAALRCRLGCLWYKGIYNCLNKFPARACIPPGLHFQKQTHLLDAYGKAPLSRAIRLAV